jgi:hypothetical protein
MGTDKFMQLSGWEHEQQSFTHGLGLLAFRAIKLAGCELSELLRHALNLRSIALLFNPEHAGGARRSRRFMCETCFMCEPQSSLGQSLVPRPVPEIEGRGLPQFILKSRPAMMLLLVRNIFSDLLQADLLTEKSA